MIRHLPIQGRRENRRIHLHFFLFFLLVQFSMLLQAQTTFPPPQNVKKPVPSVTPPGDIFIPPVAGSAGGNTPKFAEWTRTAGPDESIIATGYKLSNYTDAQEGKDSRFVVFSNNRQADARIQRLDGDKVILTIDENFPSWSMYLLWPRNENGFGYPIAINKTDAWWVGPDKTSRGQTISVYGRNLAHGNGTSSSNVFIKSLTGTGSWAVVTKVNPYRVDFTVPSLPNGNYEVWVHNGHGGDYGWSGPLMLEISDEQQWTGTTFNVRNFGAQGNGTSDDTNPIRSAINAARSAPGSTLYFPAGVYSIRDNLELTDNIRWRGDGKTQSIIRLDEAFSTSASSVIWGDVSNSMITDLGIDGNRQNTTAMEKPIALRGSTDIRINNVNFSFQDFEIMDLHLAYRIFITNCQFIGSTIFLGDGSQIFFDKCDFKLTNDAETMILSWGGEGVSVTNSTASDLDNSNPDDGAGWGKGRFFTGSGNFGSNRHTYLADNTTTDLTVRPDGPSGADQNSGEQILWEGNGTLWTGRVSSSTETTTQLAGNLDINGNSTAVIVQGKGMGQSRRILSRTVNSITVEEPWNVVPDGTTVINIGPYTEKVVIYNNFLDAKERAAASPTHIASAGIQPFGGVFNLVADKNTLNEVRTGLATWATQHSLDLDPTYFVLFVNNQVINPRWGIMNNHSVSNATNSRALLGIVYRGNMVMNPIESAVLNSQNASMGTLNDGMLYEHNSFVDVTTGFNSEPGTIRNQILYHNTFISLGTGTEPAVVLGDGMALRLNDYQNFNTFYQGSLSEPVIEAPYHVIPLNGVSGSTPVNGNLILWNSGPSLLSWSAVDNVPWLSLAPLSGDMVGEIESDSLVLTADPANLASGMHTATISVRSGSVNEFFTVVFNVRPMAPLPLDMLEFTARPAGRTVILHWKTDHEVNTKEFRVQHSTNGVNWTEIGQVPARGSGSGDYGLHHGVPVTGQNYYRLRSVDIDGQYTYSPVRNVLFGKDMAHAVQIIPNPARDKTTLYFTQPMHAPQISVYDLQGKVVRQFRASGNIQSYQVPTADIASGTYLVSITSGQLVLTSKLTVQ